MYRYLEITAHTSNTLKDTIMNSLSEVSVRNETVKRIREWYRWQLSLSDKKNLIRNFKDITRRIYRHSKITGLEAMVINSTAKSLGDVLEADPVQATLITRLTDIFHHSCVTQMSTVKEKTLRVHLQCLDSVIREYDSEMRDQMHQREKRRVIAIMRKRMDEKERWRDLMQQEEALV